MAESPTSAPPSHDNDAPRQDRLHVTHARIPLVAIGASAGGLQALESFFKACPTDAGAAYVVVQHLAPDHATLMPDLLARCTSMPVALISDGDRLAPDQVQLIPPGTLLHLEGEVLRLSPRDPSVLSLPIDTFFAAAARERPRGDVVAIVLSGTGSDGTQGAARIRAAGGLVLAQEPSSARFDGMPRSAIASGAVHRTDDAGALPAAAVDFLASAISVDADADAALDGQVGADPQDAIGRALDLLRSDGDIDFRDYKPATIWRRIERRMQTRLATTVDAYTQLLRDDPEERRLLGKDLLIGVTQFFRDQESFEALREHVQRHLIQPAADSDCLRVWLAGVATGEEAYSITMLLLEELARSQRWCQVKVFATDVDEDALANARRGLYPASIASELDPERLSRFFDAEDGGYSIKRFLRQHMMFARHNLLTDAPFTQMDLVVCRNTLIYFAPAAQERALARMEFALRPGGLLFLGPSESLSATRHSFTALDPKNKIFQRLDSGVPGSARLSLGLRRDSERRDPRPGVGRGGRGVVDGAEAAATAALVSAYAPPTLLVSPGGDVSHVLGAPDPLLSVRPGPVTYTLNGLLPPAVAAMATALVTRVVREGRPWSTETALALAPGDDEGRPPRYRLMARPVPGRGDQPWTLLSIETLPSPVTVVAGEPADADELDVIAVLEHELAATRESLQTTIEELEASNEELQATNEELISANEELQSSNEELQSLNEELNSVNAEYQAKGELLQRAGADLEAMARAAGVAMVFVDDDLRLTRFSPAACEVFRLREGDTGRPLRDIAHALAYPTLFDDLAAVVRDGEPRERQVPTIEGTSTYLVRMLPCGMSTSGAPGGVATFVDISAYQDAQRLQAVIDALPEHVAVLDDSGRICLVNRAWTAFAAGNGAADAPSCQPGTNYLDACRTDLTGEGVEGRRLAARAARGVRAVLDGALDSFSLRYPCHALDRQRWFVMNVAPVRSGNYRAVVSHVDITTWYLEDAPRPEAAE